MSSHTEEHGNPNADKSLEPASTPPESRQTFSVHHEPVQTAQKDNRTKQARTMDGRMTSVTYEDFMEMILLQSAELGEKLKTLTENGGEDEEKLLEGFSTDLSKIAFNGPENKIYPVVVRLYVCPARVMSDKCLCY